MTRVVFRTAMLWDGTGADAYPADVLVDGGRIRPAAKSLGQLTAVSAQVIDC